MSRRKFLKTSALGLGGILLAKCASGTSETDSTKKEVTESPLRGDAEGRGIITKPIVVSTWNHGMEANKAAWEILENGGNALDAVEAGVRITESDADNRSVGLGGLPDREGKVTLDACIMNHENDCGAVAFLQDIEHPISVARKGMEDTPHIMLVGKGAYDFAISKGFEHKDLLTTEAKETWLKWKASEDQKKPRINSENHDTIGMLAMDAEGNISGSCTTSGWAYKLHGRVGDSPIIGAGTYANNTTCAVSSTGWGEYFIRGIVAYDISALMEYKGLSLKEASKEVIQNKLTNLGGTGGIVAIDKSGNMVAEFNTAGMYRATMNDKGELTIGIYKN